jgi:putative FmdB family regulatory protein
MPCYEYHCWRCDIRVEVIKALKDRETDSCPKCGAKIKQVVSIPTMLPDPYWSGHVDDTFGYVTSKKQLRDREKRAGYRPSDPGDAASAKLARADRERKEDVIREKAVGETVREMLV